MNTYSSYKDSGVEWIGEVPGEWNVKRLDHFFTERKDKVDDVSYPPLSVTMKGIKDQLEGVAKSDDSSNRKLVLKSDFVINSRSDRKGSSGISFRDGSVSLINTVLEPKNIEPNYVNYLFKSYYFIEEYFRFGKGIHFDLWSTNYSVMKNIKIPVLSIEEQQQISDYLDYKTSKIDILIEKTEQKIELLKEQRTSLINTTVTKGLNPNVEMKDSGVEWIGEIPSKWKTTRLKYIFKLREEKTDTGEGELLTVTITKGIVRRRDFIKKGDHLSRSKSLKGYKVCYTNDLVNNIMKMGFRCLGISDYNGIVSPAYSVFSFINNKNKPMYWDYLLRTDLYVTEYKKRSKGIQESRMRLYDDYFLDIVSIVPPHQEQQQIVDYLDKENSKLDKLIDIESKRIKLLKEYRQSLISDVVTGKVDVRDEVLG